MKAQIWNKVLLLLCISLISCKKNTSNDLIVFDVTMDFPVKTLNIEDLADIEYLILDVSDDDYLFRFLYQMTDNYIICEARDEILFFDRFTGKPISKVSRRGNGPGEYNMSRLPVYSEINDELFIVDQFEMKVYGKDGTFKRKFPFSYTFFPFAMYDYNEGHLLLFGFPIKEGSMRDTSFMVVSKQDGFLDVIPIPFEKRVPVMIQIPAEGVYIGVIADAYPAVRNGKDDFLLTEFSTDTVFRFTTDRQLIPVLIREPSIQKMQTKIYLQSWLETGKYLFFSTQKIDIDRNTLQLPSSKGYLKEKSSEQFFQTNIQMRDYKGKELILGPSVIAKSPNQQTGIIELNVLELQTANKENRLSGKLKEVTDCLSKDDELVFMILKFR